ncbi:MAG: TolC family protein, partial [Limisphaerales bacterium]
MAILAGCVGVRTGGEKAARNNQQTIEQVYRPRDQRPTLPPLTTNSSLSDFLLFAMLSQPQVEAAYYEWAVAVQRITVERSLPDPRLTFQSDIADTVMSLMPGLMMDFPGPGKRKAAANVATAESEAKYFAFESSVLQTAFAFKKACYQL